jgi:MerR HTH family regulatory protein
MQLEVTEVLWFEQHELTLPELAELSGLPLALADELLDCGAIAPLELRHARTELRFGSTALRTARAAGRLRSDFELDVQALVLALGLLERVADLEAQLRELRARQPQRIL